MSVSTNVSTGLYIYAFLKTNGTNPVVPDSVKGIDGASIQFQSAGNLAMAMSPTESKKIRPQRKNLAAHQEVVTYLAKNHDMLPVAFGLIADDVEQVNKLLSSHRQVLSEQIDRVAGHMEMNVNLRWAVPNVVQYFVERYSDLAEARNAIASGTATRDDQIAVGQLLERLINSEREEHTARFTEVLSGICKELDIQKPREEADVMRLACLIRAMLKRRSIKPFIAPPVCLATIFQSHSMARGLRIALSILRSVWSSQPCFFSMIS